jgi:hypothetical protein
MAAMTGFISYWQNHILQSVCGDRVAAFPPEHIQLDPFYQALMGNGTVQGVDDQVIGSD